MITKLIMPFLCILFVEMIEKKFCLTREKSEGHKAPRHLFKKKLN